MEKNDNIINFPQITEIRGKIPARKCPDPEQVAEATFEEVAVFDCGHTYGYLVADGGVRCATCYAIVVNVMWRVHEPPMTA